MPRWVNDYRELNDNTVADKFPLPRIADILADCGKGKIWGKLDMTNAFFQTKVHPDHIKYTAVRTPFGLYEWVVMPQGCRNAPSTTSGAWLRLSVCGLGKYVTYTSTI